MKFKWLQLGGGMNADADATFIWFTTGLMLYECCCTSACTCTCTYTCTSTCTMLLMVVQQTKSRIGICKPNMMMISVLVIVLAAAVTANEETTYVILLVVVHLVVVHPVVDYQSWFRRYHLGFIRQVFIYEKKIKNKK